MLKKKHIALSLITIIVIIAAAIFVNMRAPQSDIEKAAFFPDLGSQIESVNHISIKNYVGEVNISRSGDIWTVDNFDGFPALPDKVKGAVVGAADLKVNAAKTALPRLYSRLGVEDPESEDATSILLTLKDAEQNKIIDVIVGKPRLSSAAQSTPGLYVRRPDDKQSYLVDGILDISASKTDWIARALFDIQADAIRSVRVEHSDGDTYTLFKNAKGQDKFELENIPEGKKIASKLITSRFGTVLQDIQINGARSKAKLTKPEENIHTTIQTFEGTVVNLIAFEHDDITYGAFEFSFDESLVAEGTSEEKIAAAKTFVTEMNTKVKDWWYQIPPFKYDIIKKRSDSVMRNDPSYKKPEKS